MTDSGAVLVAFFAQFPDGKVVDGRLLVKAVDDNSDDISDAVCIISVFYIHVYTCVYVIAPQVQLHG